MKSLLLIVPLFLGLTFAAPVESEEMVLTPAGLRPKSSILPVPGGGSIHISETEIHLLDASKNIIHIAPINNTKAETVTRRAQESGWVAYASWYNTGSPISSFSTQWSVPPAPTTNHGQTVFLFNSIEPASGAAILQPVLQYGPSAAGGGSYWSVANWYVGTSTYYTPLVTVNAGEVIQGSIELASSSGSNFNYISTYTVGSSTAKLPINNSAELVWATETLESYNVVASSDYPKGSTVFSAINLKTTSGTPSVSWNATDDTQDGLTVTVAENGATNAEVVIKYET